MEDTTMSDIKECPALPMTTAEVASADEKDEEPVTIWWHVNRKLLPMKIHWFLFFGSFAGTSPACIAHCTLAGMSLSEMGMLYAVLPLVQFFAKILVGNVADKYRRHKTVFLTSIFLMGASTFAINYLPVLRNDVHNVTWTPPDGVLFERLRRSHPDQRSPATKDSFPVEEMKLTLCDHNVSNQYFTALSSATVTCNVSGLQDMSNFFCEDEHLVCISNDRYSFHVTPSVNQTVLNLEISPDGHLQTGNSSCVTVPIARVSFNPKSFQETQMNGKMATSSSCHLQDTKFEMISVACETVCVASVKPSVYAPVAEKRDMTLVYVGIWVIYIISYGSYGTLMSTSDTIVLHLLGGNSKDFGKTRVFGSLGWGLMAPIAGFMIDKVSEGRPEIDYSPGFYLVAAFCTVDLLMNIPSKISIPENSKTLYKDVFHVFRRPEVILLASVVLVNGVTSCFLWTYLIVYLDELSGGVQLIIGLNYAVECFLSEIPFFIVSGWFVAKLGHSHSMTLSLFICGLKTFLYSLLYNPWYVFFIALLHWATYGLLYASMATYIAEIAPPGTSATLQGTFQGIFEGVGGVFGNLLGGYAYERFGGRQTFVLFGAITMGASVVHLVIAFILKRIEINRPSSGEKIQIQSSQSNDP